MFNPKGITFIKAICKDSSEQRITNEFATVTTEFEAVFQHRGNDVMTAAGFLVGKKANLALI